MTAVLPLVAVRRSPFPSWACRLGASDLAAAAAVAAFGTFDALVNDYNGMLTGLPVWVALVVTWAGSAAIALRRRHPYLVLVVTLLTHLAAFTPAALAVAAYTVGARTRSLPRLVAISAVVTTVHAWAILGTVPNDTRDAANTAAFAIGPLLWGYAVAVRHDLAASWQQRAVAGLRETELRVAQAQREERGRIAREMHDTVAHRVGHMTITAAALGIRVPKAVAEAELIHREGRAALADLRQALGLLTRAGHPGTVRLAGVAQVEDLVAATRRAAGSPLALTLVPPVAPLPDAVDRAVYRAAQEGLTNAVKHAPGAPVTLVVDCRSPHLVVRVVNGPGGPPLDLPGSGYGLVGLAERLQLLGGTLTTERLDGGGFQLTGTIPNPTTGPEAQR